MRRPVAVVLAAWLSGAASAGSVWFGGTAFLVLRRTGGWGDPVAVRGMVAVGAVGVLGAVVLVAGAVRTWNGTYTWTRVPLLAVLVLGCIGEVADAVGRAPVGETLTGAAVIGAAGLPLALLCTGAAREFAAARRAP